MPRVKIGYLGDLYKKFPSTEKKLGFLQDVVSQNELNIIILTGGLGENHEDALNLIDGLCATFDGSGVQFKFVFGNTDLYNTDTPDRHRNTEDAIHRLKIAPGCLIGSPIIYNNVKIYGVESWYDYSLYRGGMVSAKEVMAKKRLPFYHNLDAFYITEEQEYLNGIDNTWDSQYALRCKRDMVYIIESNFKRFGRVGNIVIVGYFKPLKYFVGEGRYKGFAGAFEGSSYIGSLMAQNGLTRYVFGHSSPRHSCRVKSTEYVCSSVKDSKGLYIEEYDLSGDRG